MNEEIKDMVESTGANISSQIQQLAGEIVKQDDSVFDSIAKTAIYFPRLQLMSSNSTVVQEGKIQHGHYAMIKDKVVTDLGSDVDIIPVAWRPKALRTLGDNLLVVYNPQHTEFKKIEEEADIKDSGCMFGPEFLVYLIDKEIFVTFFMASKTARREAGNVRAYIGNICTLRHVVIKNKKFTWIGPQVVASQTPSVPPDMDAVKEAMELFAAETAKEPTVETIDASDAASRER